MNYQDITQAEQAQLVKNSIKDLEAQHMTMCIQITANRNVVGADIGALEARRNAIETGIRNLRREYADLLALTVAEPELEPTNGRALHPVGVE